MSTAGEIDAVLPQTQCTKCGFQGCRPYADAIARGEADINRCPPGGDAGIRVLAAVTGRPYRPLDPANGVEHPLTVARIDESRCIGCTLCIQACPVDAILGAPRLMHTVIGDLCTGCDLCVAPCPVDCIEMVPVSSGIVWDRPRADAARLRFEARNARLAREHSERADRIARQTAANRAAPDADAKRAAIAAAVERARAKRAAAKAHDPA